jgi:hypothetical protein
MKGFTACRNFSQRGGSQKLSGSAEFHASRVRYAGRGEPKVAGRGKSRPESVRRKSKSFAAQYGAWKIFPAVPRPSQPTMSQ